MTNKTEVTTEAPSTDAAAQPKKRLTTSAMIASIAAEGQATKPAPLGHALVEAARSRPGIVGMTALGIGLGSPLAGWLSGRKVELGLVLIGGIGMIVVIIFAALLLYNLIGLVICIVLIGFFTGFYLVPLFTQQQHRAPKHMKGDVIATCNFTNVVGAIAASLLVTSVDSNRPTATEFMAVAISVASEIPKAGNPPLKPRAKNTMASKIEHCSTQNRLSSTNLENT